MNKMFKKILATTATLAIAATMCASAFAAGETATHTTGAVKVDGYAAVPDATQYTVMIFGEGFEVTDADGKVTYNPAEIYYINQGAKLYAADENDTAGLLDNMLVKLAEGETGLKDGTYTVRIGNDKGTVVNVPLTVSTVQETKTYTITCTVADSAAEVYMDDVLGTKVSDGVYTFEKENGTYTLVVKAPGAFTRTIENVTVADADADVSTTLKYGLTRENATKVELEDLSAVLSIYNVTSTEDNYSLSCDFDRNGTVELEDLSAVLSNYNLSVDDAY